VIDSVESLVVDQVEFDGCGVVESMIEADVLVINDKVEVGVTG
jgi:hypothetical protein